MDTGEVDTERTSNQTHHARAEREKVRSGMEEVFQSDGSHLLVCDQLVPQHGQCGTTRDRADHLFTQNGHESFPGTRTSSHHPGQG